MKKLILKAVNKEAVTSKETLQQGRLAVVNSQAGTKYQVMDEATGLPAKGQVIKKKGKDLIVSVDGEEVSVIHDFYADAPAGEAPTYQVSEASGAAGEGASASGGSGTGGDSGVVTGGSSSGVSDGVVWNSGADGAFQVASAADALGAEDAGLTTTQMVGLGLGSLAAGGGAAAAIAAGGGAAAGGAAAGSVAAATVVTGMVAAGPVVDQGTSNNIKVAIYNTSGVKLGEGDVNGDGTFSVNIGSYTGAVVVKVYDTNDTVPDYMDEASRQAKDLSSPLSAVGYVDSAGGEIVINVTPLTTLAAQKLGVDVGTHANDAPATDGTFPVASTKEEIAAANSGVAKALGLNVDDLLSAAITPTVGLNGGDAVGNDYGVILAALAGDGALGLNVFETLLSDMSAAVRTYFAEDGSLNQAGVELLVRGAALSDNAQMSQGLAKTVLDLFTKVDGALSIDPISGDNIVANSDTEFGTLVVAISGKANPDSVVQVYVDGNRLGLPLTVGSGGEWSLEYVYPSADYPPITDGAHVISARTADGLVAERVVLWDMAGPTVVSMEITSQVGGVTQDGVNYLNEGDTVSVTVTMSEEVVVNTTGGTPKLKIDIGGTLVDATYVSGSGSKDLVFTYQIQSGQNATGGIAIVADSLALNSATIKDFAQNDAVTGNTAVAANVAYVVDTTVGSLTAALADDTGSSGSDKITSNGTVNVTGLDADIAKWEYSTNGGTDWVLGISTTVEGVTTNTFTLDPDEYADGAVLVRQTDLAGNVSTATSLGAITVDLTGPVGSMADGQTLTNTGSLQVQSSEVGVAYLVRNNVDVTNDIASITGAAADLWNSVDIANINTDTALSLAGLSDGTYKLYTVDKAGNLSAAAASTVLVDSNPPTDETFAITGQEGGALGSVVNGETTYLLNEGDTVSVTVTMSEEVVVDTTGGTPTLKIDIGGTLVDATYVSGSGSKDLVFTYQIQSGQNAADGIAIVANGLALNGATIKDFAQNDAVTGNAAVAANTAYVVDTTVGSLTAALADDTGSSGSDKITKNGTVNVTGLDADAVSWEYSTGTTDAEGNRVWHTGTSTTVEGVTTNTFTLDPDEYADGAVLVRQTDLAGNVSTATSLGAITVDLTGPVGSMADGQTLTNTGSLQVQSSEVGVAYLVRNNVDVTNDIASITGAAADLWNSVDIANINSDTTLSLTGLSDGTYKLYTVDKAGNLSAAATNTVLVDSNPPTDETFAITGQEGGALGSVVNGATTYLLNEGDTVSVTVTMSEEVVVNTTGGTPKLKIDIGGTLVDATYDSGSGSKDLVFTYQIQSGQNATGGIAIVADSLALNGATIKDFAQNDAVTGNAAVAANAAYVVDTTVGSLTAALADDTGSSGSDKITSNGTVNVTGLDADAVSWEYSTGTTDAEGNRVWHTGTSTTVGGVTTNTFTLDPDEYANGAVLVRQTDLAGNVSTETSLGAITVDLTASHLENQSNAGTLLYVAPQYTADSLTVTNLDVRSPIVLDFDEAVSIDASNQVTLSRIDGGASVTAVLSYDGNVLDRATSAVLGTWALNDASNEASDQLTINWTRDLDLGASYELQIAEGSLSDAAGNQCQAITVGFDTIAAATPTTLTTVSPNASGSMDSAGAAQWFEITSYGSSYTLDGDKSYVIVFKDSSTIEGDTNVTLSGEDPSLVVTLTNFGADDRIYFDSGTGHTPATLVSFLANMEVSPEDRVVTNVDGSGNVGFMVDPWPLAGKGVTIALAGLSLEQVKAWEDPNIVLFG